VLSVRPKIAELVFRLYGRSLHPELFVIHQTRTVKRGDYQATVSITSAGHVVQWRYQGLTLTEVAAAAHHPLPQRRRLMAHRLRGNQSDGLQCRGGIHYETKFSLEPADNKKIMNYQKELTLQATRQGMLHQFEAGGRLEMGALSYISVQSRDKTFRVQAFHTFPEDRAMLKIQSWYRLP
jgi:hypothetical protein